MGSRAVMLLSLAASLGSSPFCATVVRAQSSQPGPTLQWAPRPRVGLPEYAVTLGTPVLLRLTDFALPTPTSSRLGGGVLFDDAVRSALVLSRRSARDDADLFSDVSWISSIAYPFVDAVAVAWILHASPDVAWQLLVISLQTFSITAFVTEIAIHHAARERPGGAECDVDGSYSTTCIGPASYHSLPSGHTAGAFTGAGLACSQHLNLPLYGGGAGDVSACALALAWASANGVARLMADRHWATDVLLGAAIGLSLGWLLPELVYYVDTHEAPDAGARTALTPFSDGQSIGLMGLGQF